MEKENLKFREVAENRVFQLRLNMSDGKFKTPISLITPRVEKITDPKPTNLNLKLLPSQLHLSSIK